MTAQLHYTPAAIAAHEAAINAMEWEAADARYKARERWFCDAVGRVLIVGSIGLPAYILYALWVS